MIGLIKRIMGDSTPREADPDPGDVHIALCVLMLEAAHADGECSADEMAHVVETLVTRLGVDRAAIDELIDRAYRRRREAIDLFTFTRYINQHYSKEQKRAVMESVWRIIHLDGRLEGHEDHFAHKLANLLRLTHSELIEAKIQARKQLEDDSPI